MLTRSASIVLLPELQSVCSMKPCWVWIQWQSFHQDAPFSGQLVFSKLLCAPESKAGSEPFHWNLIFDTAPFTEQTHKNIRI